MSAIGKVLSVRTDKSWEEMGTSVLILSDERVSAGVAIRKQEEAWDLMGSGAGG